VEGHSTLFWRARLHHFMF